MLSIIHCLEGYDKVQNAHSTFLTFSCAFDVNTSEFQTTFSKPLLHIGPLLTRTLLCMYGWLCYLLAEIIPEKKQIRYAADGPDIVETFLG